MKKILFLITLTVMILAAVPRIQAQNLTQQQTEEYLKLMDELSEGKMGYGEFLRRYGEIVNPPDTTTASPQLLTPAGKAWVIQDNQVQGSGKAIVIKPDGEFEVYERRLGVWSPYWDNVNRTITYTATGTKLTINNGPNLAGNYNYTISGNGSTLTITRSDINIIAGAYTLRELPRVQAAGGTIVNPAGTAWADYTNGTIGRGHFIFHTDGIRYSFGGSGAASPWDFRALEIWNTYTTNTSTGYIIMYYHDNRQNKPEELSYSVTDFGGGNKTLRMWRVSKDFPHDTVYKLVPTPSGFQLPKVR